MEFSELSMEKSSGCFHSCKYLKGILFNEFHNFMACQDIVCGRQWRRIATVLKQ